MKDFKIYRVNTLPQTGRNGDQYLLKKPNNRYEAYVVQPDGTLAFNQGITDDQNSRLERLSSDEISKVESITTGDISKLKEDYTKAEIDNKITDLGNLSTSSKINLGDSTVLPVPPQSGGVTIPNAWVELAQNVTYTQAGGSPITGIDGHRSIAEWDNGNEVWSLVDMGALPIVPVDGEVEEGDNKAVSGNEIASTTKVIYKWNSAKIRQVGDWVQRDEKIYVVNEDTSQDPITSSKYTLLGEEKYRLGFLNSKSNQIIIDNNSRTILFKSGIGVVRGDGRCLTTEDQTLSIGAASYSLYFNVNSLEFSISVITNPEKYRDVNEVLLGTINGQSGTINVTGFDNYTLDGIQYPYDPTSETTVIYKWTSSKTRKAGELVDRNGVVYLVLEDTNENPISNPKYTRWFDEKYRIGFVNSKSNQILIDSTSRTILFKAGLSVVRGDGRYILPNDQTISIGVASLSLYFNTESLTFSTPVITNPDRYLDKNEVLVGVINGQVGSQNITLSGIDSYTYDGVEFPSYTTNNDSSYFNRWFNKYNASRTEEQKKWLNAFIVDAEGYNLNGGVISLYRIGKNVNSGQVYLSFILNDKGSTITKFLFSEDFNNTTNVAFDSNIHTGVKTYLFRAGRVNYDKSIRLKITVDWDLIPEGDYVSESNANASILNTLFITDKIDKYSFQRGRGSQINLLPTPILNEYYSYIGDADYSFDGMIPKDNYGDINVWYSKWEELRLGSLPSDYKITRELLTDAVPTGDTPQSIWAYRFQSEALKKSDTSDSSNINKKIKICVTTGHHGGEKMGSFCMYEIMKMIIENEYSSKLINYLRYNVEFVIVPCVNPYAWGASGGVGQRYNYNGVDLNRNFEAGWQFTTTLPSGPYAYSEIESYSVGNWMKREFNDESVIGLVIDNFHGQNEADPKNYYINWLVASDDNLAVNMWREMISEMSVKIKERYPEVPQSNDYIIGTINNYIAGGYTKDQFYQEGYPASFQLEIMQNFRFDPEYKSFDNKAMTCAIESILNLIRYSLTNYIPYINNKIITKTI